MRYHVDRSAAQPAYLQLYAQLRDDITSGVYPFGGRLPSKRSLAAAAGVSVIPAERAYALLCDEGYAQARERSGCFVCYRAGELAAAPETTPAPKTQPHPAGSAFPFSVLAKTMRRVLLDRGEALLVKSPNHGCAELRSAIASYLARSNGISVLPEQVIIGSGAEYLYGLIVQLLGVDRVYAVEDPCYDKIRRVYRAYGVTCEALKMGRNGIRASELARATATVLHVTPFNSYPSGATADASTRQAYLHWAETRGGWLIEDNYDAELTVSKKHEDTLFSLSQTGRVLYLNTFSQTIAPSIRAGYLLLPPSLLEPFERLLGFYSCTVPVFEQYVLAELLQSGNFERHLNRVRRQKRRAE